MAVGGRNAARSAARPRIIKAERERQEALEHAFETTKYYCVRNEGGLFPSISMLFNVGFALLIAERDIQALKIDALTHPDEWARKLCARIILLTIYEWDADAMTGKSFRIALEDVGASDALKDAAFAALRKLRAVQRKANKQFSHVRNSAIAHRDPDALVQYRAIRDLQVDDVVALGTEFYAGVAAFIAVLTEMLRRSSAFEVMLRQMGRNRTGNA